MIHNYPSLDSSEHKSKDVNNAGYEYAEPPRSSLEINQQNLNQPLIDSAPLNTPDANKNTYILASILTPIEFLCSYFIIKFATMFEYCFWEFSLNEFNNSQFYPLYSRQTGSIPRLLKDIGCNKTDFDRCPGMCGAIDRYSDVSNYFVWAYIVRYFVFCSAFSWLAIESKKKNYNKAKKIFAYFQTFSFILLASIFAYVLIYPGFQDLQDPADLKDGAVPVSFEWKIGFYLIIFIAVYMPASSLLVYSKLKSSN